MSKALDTIGFAERVLTLLDRGTFTATYKYAVMLALMDLCLEGTSKAGEPPLQLTTRQLAGQDPRTLLAAGEATGALGGPRAAPEPGRAGEHVTPMKS